VELMAKAKMPTISVGVPVYNGENFLELALRSLQEQTFGDFEVIISDNASTDGTEEIARAFAAEDERFRYVRNDANLGANPNYNRTFALSRGAFFRWHAHDDVCDPKYLALCHEVLSEDPTVSLVHTNTVYIDRTGQRLIELRHGFLDCDGFIERLTIDHHAPALLAAAEPHRRLDAIVNRMSVFFDIFGLMRRDDVRQTMLLPAFYGADKVFLAEMALQGRILRLDDDAFFRRCHASASTRTTSMRSLASWSDAGRSFDPYPALIMKGYLCAVRSADLGRAERLRCVAAVGKRLGSPYKLLRGR
jgi:glycosyltransferase involved in cell wall biosynthesis